MGIWILTIALLLFPKKIHFGGFGLGGLHDLDPAQPRFKFETWVHGGILDNFWKFRRFISNHFWENAIWSFEASVYFYGEAEMEAVLHFIDFLIQFLSDFNEIFRSCPKYSHDLGCRIWTEVVPDRDHGGCRGHGYRSKNSSIPRAKQNRIVKLWLNVCINEIFTL